MAILVTYYSSPLATLAKVLRQRNSSSLHWALCMMNTINGALWFAYGLAVKDWFIWCVHFWPEHRECMLVLEIMKGSCILDKCGNTSMPAPLCRLILG